MDNLAYQEEAEHETSFNHISNVIELDVKASSKDKEDKKDAESLRLKREVGLVSGIALIVGTMIGSGIFVSPGDLLLRTGSVGLSLVIWASCGVLSTLGAISYIELGTVVTASGGEYAYLLASLGPLPAFLFAWVSTFVLKPASLAIICLSFSKYTVEAVNPSHQVPDIAVKLIAAAAILLITYVNCASVKLATKVQNVFTAAKLLAIGIIVVVGIYMMAKGKTEHLSAGFTNSTESFGDIATAFYSGLWAYDGWNNLNYVTEEIKDPYRNLPLAIIIGLPLVTTCYLLVNVAYLTVMTPTEVATSPAVAVTFARYVLEPVAFIMPIFVAMSTFGAANGSQFTAGRITYVASRQGHLVDILSFINVKSYTPSPALIFNTLIAIVMLIPGNIASLIDFFSFSAWIFYGSAMLAVIVLRFKRKDAPRPFKVPIIIPGLVLIVSVYLVFAPIVDNPQIQYLYATLFILAGLIFYIPFVHYKKELHFMTKITTFFQLLLNVAASDPSEIEKMT